MLDKNNQRQRMKRMKKDRKYHKNVFKIPESQEKEDGAKAVFEEKMV